MREPLPKDHLQAGDEAEFRDRRGRKIKAIVAGIHERKRKGRVRSLAAQVTGDPDSLNQWCYHLVSEKEVIWYQVSCYEAKPTGRKVSASEAYARMREVKGQIAQSKSKRESAALEEADQGGLMNARLGDIIQAKFRDCSGWSDVIFRGFIRGSGNVRYEQPSRPGRTRSMHPKYFRLKPQEEA